MAGFNIETFKAKVKDRNGFMRNNRFLMTFPTPTGLFSRSGAWAVNRDIEFWCESVTLPGYQLMTHDVRRWTYGPSEKRPFAPNFTPLQCSFLVDNKGDIMNFFHDWLQSIIPHDTDQGINAPSRFGGLPYEVRYKVDYVTELNIYTYSETGEPIQNIVCKEAFPSSIVDIPLSWGDTNNVVRLQVTFDYLDWFSRPVNTPQ